MSLVSGSRLGSFEIVSPLGKGGMGEVWRARDTKLGREVAIKVLPPEFTTDMERLARFDREARLLASLNHPHIASIYGLEEASDQKFLVMELAEGDTLADRIGRGAIPVDESLAIASQIAEALEAAHEKGIIHRDLKPANIVVDTEGKVRVLDFGLAKALDADIDGDSDITNSPTMVRAATGAGVILGTASYMSPEQARGKKVDRRADIWAFGVVLWEMLTGRRLFRGETVSDTLAAVLTAPVDLEGVPSDTPPGLRWILERCLERDPKIRLRDIGEARVILDRGLPATTRTDTTTDDRASSRRWLPFAALLAGVVIGVGGMFLAGRSSTDAVDAPSVIRATIGIEPSSGIDLGASLDSSGMAIAWDGSRVVFAGSFTEDGQRVRRLCVRDIGAAEATPLQGTEGARDPVFSPDGSSVAFIRNGDLYRVMTAGGSPREIPLPLLAFATDVSFTGDGSMIVAGLKSEGRIPVIVRVFDDGARVETLDELGPETLGVAEAALLPGEKAILYTRYEDGLVTEVINLETKERRVIANDATGATWAASGHILYALRGRIEALPFDLETLSPTGPPIPIQDDLSTGIIYGSSHFDLSRNGTLVAIPQDAVNPRTDSLLWIGAEVKPESIGAPPAYYADPRVSPNGRLLAVSVPTEDNDIWVRDLERGTQSRLSFEPGEDETPVWSTDGRSVYWAAQRGDTRKVIRRNADGSGSEVEIWNDPRHFHLADRTPDGATILIDIGNPDTGVDIIALEPGENGAEEKPLLNGPYDEKHPRLSPDGRWLVYVSDESGRDEVYMQPFPGMDRKVQLSDEGGMQPLWSPDGRRVFYRRTSVIVVVDVGLNGTDLSVSKPSKYLDEPIGFGKGGRHWGYDIGPDGRFLATPVESSFFPQSIDITFGLFEELGKAGSR